MSKTTPDAKAIGEAVLLIASLFTGGATAPQAAAAKAADKPKETSTPASPETPAPPKDEPAADTGKVEGNSQGLSVDDFKKLGMAFAKDMGDQGAKAKEIWSKYTQEDGKPVDRFGTVQPKDFDAMIAEWEEARLAG